MKHVIDNNENKINLNKHETSQFDGEKSLKMLPIQSLRVSSTVNSKANAIKEVGLYENVSDVLEEALEELEKKYSNDEQEEIKLLEKRSIEKKILKYKKQKKRNKHFN